MQFCIFGAAILATGGRAQLISSGIIVVVRRVSIVVMGVGLPEAAEGISLASLQDAAYHRAAGQADFGSCNDTSLPLMTNPPKSSISPVATPLSK